ncbi:MAG: asparaginase [Saccharospirillum sp.]
MARYLILNTGGTIGMAQGPHGLTPQPGLLQQALAQQPELAGWHQHELQWHDWAPLIDSSDIHPHHWYELAARIRHSDADGVLVVHGTDTLAYTGAALSFLLSDCPVPVVITGSMRPLSAAVNDAVGNLLTALSALEARRTEVVVAFNGTVLPASRLTKIDTREDHAFATPNWDANLWNTPPGRRLTTLDQPWRPSAIGVQTLFPGMPMDGLMSMVERNYRALVLSVYGSGNVMADAALQRILHRAADLQRPVFVRSQCLYGAVQLGQYATSALLTEIDATPCGGMPLEAIITKLQLLCAEYDHGSEVTRGFLEPWAREWQSLES